MTRPVVAHYLGAAHPLRIACSVHRAAAGEPCIGARSVCSARDIANVRRVRAEAKRAVAVKPVGVAALPGAIEL